MRDNRTHRRGDGWGGAAGLGILHGGGYGAPDDVDNDGNGHPICSNANFAEGDGWGEDDEDGGGTGGSADGDNG